MRHLSSKKPGSITLRDSAQSPLQRRTVAHEPEASIMHESPELLSPGGITALQRSIGNQGVQRLLHTSAAAPASAAPIVIQRKEVRVPHGSAVKSAWKFLRTEGKEDVYDDGLPATDNEKLDPSRKALNELEDEDELSDLELSDTEIDLNAKSGKKKVYRIAHVRDAQKVVEKIMRKNPETSIAVRVSGSNTIFRLEGRRTQFFVKVVARGALKQSDGSTAEGAMPPREKDDPKATGKLASYEHVVSELRDYDSGEVASAIYKRYFERTPYPPKFSARAKAKMDELFVLLSIAETFRTRYAFVLLIAAIKAIQNGESMENVLYKGKGQLEALHVGASSHKDSRVSGQLMEQNVGKGRNDPHPTQKSMSVSDEQFRQGTKRTFTLFEKAFQDKPHDEAIQDMLIKPIRTLKKSKSQGNPKKVKPNPDPSMLGPSTTDLGSSLSRPLLSGLSQVPSFVGIGTSSPFPTTTGSSSLPLLPPLDFGLRPRSTSTTTGSSGLQSYSPLDFGLQPRFTPPITGSSLPPSHIGLGTDMSSRPIPTPGGLSSGWSFPLPDVGQIPQSTSTLDSSRSRFTPPITGSSLPPSHVGLGIDMSSRSIPTSLGLSSGWSFPLRDVGLPPLPHRMPTGSSGLSAYSLTSPSPQLFQPTTGLHGMSPYTDPSLHSFQPTMGSSGLSSHMSTGTTSPLFQPMMGSSGPPSHMSMGTSSAKTSKMMIPRIDSFVRSEQKPAGKWDADIVVLLKQGAPPLRIGESVRYGGRIYQIKNITPTGKVLLKM